MDNGQTWAERREKGIQYMKSQKLPCHVILIKSSSFLVFWASTTVLPETWFLCSKPLPEGMRRLQDSGYTNPTALHPHRHHRSTRSEEEKHLCCSCTEQTGRLLVGYVCGTPTGTGQSGAATVPTVLSLGL